MEQMIDCFGNGLGVGKSTLLKAIASHRIKGLPSKMTIVYVEQEILGTETSVLDTVLEADKERLQLLLEEQELSTNESAAQALDRLTEIYARLKEIDAWSAEARAAEILSGLQFSPEMQLMQTRQLSGGWRMRYFLLGLSSRTGI